MVEHLPAINLEMILGYTVVTAVVYAAWRAKALNANCAFRAPELVYEWEAENCKSIGELIFA